MIRLLLLFMGLSCSATCQITDGLSDAEKRGKAIYELGSPDEGEQIEVIFSGTRFNAKLLPCFGCHGDRGEGIPEGGVVPSNITWSALSRTYVRKMSNGRERGSYDRISFKRALLQGIDPNGNQLSDEMPRYEMSPTQLDDLISYLKIIEFIPDQGIRNSAINLGIVMPDSSRDVEHNKAIYNTLLAYLDLVNNAGGLYNRRVELKPFYLKADSFYKQQQRLKKFIEHENIFAIIEGVSGQIDSHLINTVSDIGIPTMMIRSVSRPNNVTRNDNVFYLLPGIVEELSYLVDLILKGDSTIPESLHIYNSNEISIDKFSQINSRIDLAGSQNLNHSTSSDVKNKLNELKSNGVSIVVINDPHIDIKRWLVDASMINWYPTVFITSNLKVQYPTELPIQFENKIYRSLVMNDLDRNDKSMEWFNLMSMKYNLNANYLEDQLSILVCGILITESMMEVGRDLTRRNLIRSLENIRSHKSGYLPPITFGLNRRIGSDKIYVQRLNVKLLKWESFDLSD